MWDLIVSVPDHCLSFYFVLVVSYLLDMTLTMTVSCDLICMQLICEAVAYDLLNQML